MSSSDEVDFREKRTVFWRLTDPLMWNLGSLTEYPFPGYKNNEDMIKDPNNDNSNTRQNSQYSTSKKKKTSNKKRLKDALQDYTMLKRLIKELNTLSNSVLDVSESQLKAPGNFTELYNAFIKAEGELKDKFTTYKVCMQRTWIQRKLNDEVAKQLPNDLSKNAIEKIVERARKIYDLFSGIGVIKYDSAFYQCINEKLIKLVSSYISFAAFIFTESFAVYQNISYDISTFL
ncbi:hypothetical protein RhiirA1_466411 [Rhizophagus irregularis]|uniref:Uncharacterized protein n=1 Tax=Rhizophagus irregularis TaxID=588596 RepID=A0A2N0RE13_9GLOM|nr:hypothetical protein RhiirA1_466411 [Rhizophagus irregularis]